jgi:hypothetical protein
MAAKRRAPEIVIPPGAPVVPPELIPPLEQPAYDQPGRPLAVAAAAVGYLLVVALIVVAAWSLLSASAPSEPARPVVEVAMRGVEAWATQDLRALEPLLPAATVATPEFARALASASASTGYTFGAPRWNGDTVAVPVRVRGGQGEMRLYPATDSAGGVAVSWSGATFRKETWRVTLIREADGVKLLGIQIGTGRVISFARADVTRTFGTGGG